MWQERLETTFLKGRESRQSGFVALALAFTDEISGPCGRSSSSNLVFGL